MQNLHYAHGGQQEHHDTCCTTHIIQEHIIIYVILHRLARRQVAVKECPVVLSMSLHHEISTVADVDHPSHSTNKYCDSTLVHTSGVSGSYHNIT